MNMKLSELIDKLLKNYTVYGDIEVFTDMDWCYSEPDPWVVGFHTCDVRENLWPSDCKFPECVGEESRVLIL